MVFSSKGGSLSGWHFQLIFGEIGGKQKRSPENRASCWLRGRSFAWGSVCGLGESYSFLRATTLVEVFLAAHGHVLSGSQEVLKGE
jgi:hypothetical protein